MKKIEKVTYVHVLFNICRAFYSLSTSTNKYVSNSSYSFYQLFSLFLEGTLLILFMKRNTTGNWLPPTRVWSMWSLNCLTVSELSALFSWDSCSSSVKSLILLRSSVLSSMNFFRVSTNLSSEISSWGEGVSGEENVSCSTLFLKRSIWGTNQRSHHLSWKKAST